MTRLEAFAERVTHAMFDAAQEVAERNRGGTLREAARAVLEREVRAAVLAAFGDGGMVKLLDEPAHPERG